MQRLPNVYPANTTQWPNQNGTFDVGAASEGAKILMRNLTPLNLRLDFYNGSTDTLSAWEHNVWTLDGDTKSIGWSIDPDSPNVVSPPSNVVYLTLFNANEKVPGTYPVFSVLQSNVGNVGGVTTTGTASSDFFNVKDVSFAGGAKGDGTTDDTAALAACNTAVATNGGIMYFPPGIFLCTGLTIYSNVTYMGAGPGATILRLKSGSNTDLFSANVANINFATANGSGSATAASNFVIRDMTLDGNKAGQTAGPSYCIRAYAYGYRLINLHCINGYSGGRQLDYSGPYPNSTGLYEYQWENTRDLFHNGIGVEIGGPTDGQWINGEVAFSGSHNIHICPNSNGLQATDVHAYSGSGAAGIAWLVESGLSATNCEAEGSNTCQLAIITTNSVKWIGGAIFASDHTGFGVQIGQAAGNTPYSGETHQSAGLTTAVGCGVYVLQGVVFSAITSATGCIQFVNDTGGSIDALMYLPSGSGPAYTGTPSARTTLKLNILGTTLNNTLVNDGGIRSVSGIINVPSGRKHSFQVNDVEQAFIDANGINLGPSGGLSKTVAKDVIDAGSNDTYLKSRSTGNVYFQAPNGTTKASVQSDGLHGNDISLDSGTFHFISGTMSRQQEGHSSSTNGVIITHGLGANPITVFICTDIVQAGSATVGAGSVGSTTFTATVGAGSGFWWRTMTG